MDGQRFERALIGFLVGGLAGAGMSYLFMWIFNKVSIWMGREPVQITWASVLPLAILFGLSMAINMAHPPLGD